MPPNKKTTSTTSADNTKTTKTTNQSSSNSTNNQQESADLSAKKKTGQVKWFNNQLNYGFITVLDEGSHNGVDVFVHQTNIKPQVSNYRTLSQGEYVSFELTHNTEDKHPFHATNVTGYGGGKMMCDFYNPSNNRNYNQQNNTRNNRNSDNNDGFKQVRNNRTRNNNTN